jgi:heat shock protein HslJ
MSFKPVALITALLMTAACFSTTSSLAAEKNSQAGTKQTGSGVSGTQTAAPHAADWQGTWVATRIQGKKLKGKIQTTLDIANDGAISGNGGCNRFMGNIKFDGNKVTVTPVGSTMMACPKRQMEQEKRFHAALEQVKTWKIHKDKLVLIDDKDREVLRLKRVK